MADSWSDARPIRALISAFVSRLGPRDLELMRRAGVISWWETSVPPEIRRHTLAVDLRAGELLVHVDSSAWANELSALSEQLRVMIEEGAGEGTVDSVRFTVSRRVAMAATEDRDKDDLGDLYRPEDIEPVALSPQERRQVESAAEQIEDPELRLAFVEAMVTDMELEKGRKAANASQRAAQKRTE
jgi:hypothetical protein